MQAQPGFPAQGMNRDGSKLDPPSSPWMFPAPAPLKVEFPFPPKSLIGSPWVLKEIVAQTGCDAI